MLRRMPLTLKLSLVVALAVALSTALVAIAVHSAARRGFDRYLALQTTQRTEALRALLEEHYAEQGDWQGIDALLRRQSGRPLGMGMHEGMAPGTMSLMVVDRSGRVRYDAGMTHVGRMLPRGALRSAVPLVVREQTVGYLVAQTGVQETAFYRRLVAAIVSSGALAAVLAIGAGLALTEGALRPLKQLSAATERIAAGDLSARVQVQAHDEVGELAARFNRMAEDLQRQDQLRRRLMNDIAHELRTPLTVMQATLEALQDGVYPLDQEHLRPVYEQTLLLKRLVNDMRDLALAEAGQMALDLAPMDTAALLRRVVARFRPEAEARGVALAVNVPDDLPVPLADAQRMEQVLGNLLSNALRHTPAGGTVRVSAERTPTGLCIRVQDTGEGIAPEDLPHVFERFYRADPARQRGEQGHTGLGLAIARELVRAHGGELSADSVPGEGTTMCVNLPLGEGAAHLN